MKEAPEQRRQALMAQGDFDGIVQLANEVCRKASEEQDYDTLEAWQEYQLEAAAASGDPYYQALRGQVEGPDPIDKIGKHSHSTALIGASFKGNIELVRSLLERGASVEATDRGGSTPLIAAADENHADIVRLLAERGANVAARDKNGQTALHYTAWQGHVDAAKALLELGLDPHLEDGQGFTALHMAAGAKSLEMLELLVPVTGVNIRMSTSGGTPLMYAAKEDSIPHIEALLKLGADPKLRDNDGDNAADYAEAYHCERAFRYLRQRRSSTADRSSEKPREVAEGKPPALRVEWDMDVGEARLRWSVAPDAPADPSRSALWDDYKKAAAVTPPGNWTLPGAPCASFRGPLLNRTIEPLAHYEHLLKAYHQLAKPRPADELVRCAMMFTTALIQNELAAEGLKFSREDAWDALMDVMGQSTRNLTKPFGLIAQWLGGVGILGAVTGHWPEVTAVLVFLREIEPQLEATPTLRAELDDFFSTLMHRGADQMSEAEGPVRTLAWAEKLRTLMEPGGTVVLPLREITRKILIQLADFPAIVTMAREVCEWARQTDNADALDEWQSHANKAATATKDPFQRARRGDFDGLETIDETGLFHRTALMGAAASGDVEGVRGLLDRGAAVNFTDPNGWTALMLAAMHGHAAAIRLLVERGADLNALNKGGESALHVAVWSGRAEAVQALVSLGSNPHTADKHGRTALLCARQAGHKEIVPILSGSA